MVGRYHWTAHGDHLGKSVHSGSAGPSFKVGRSCGTGINRYINNRQMDRREHCKKVWRAQGADNRPRIPVRVERIPEIRERPRNRPQIWSLVSPPNEWANRKMEQVWRTTASSLPGGGKG